MSIFKSLFGKSKSDTPTASAAQAEEYKGFMIFARPTREGSQYRICARIERVINGETMVHHMIRADTLQDESDAREASVAKAKVMIDQQADGVFRA